VKVRTSFTIDDKIFFDVKHQDFIRTVNSQTMPFLFPDESKWQKAIDIGTEVRRKKVPKYFILIGMGGSRFAVEALYQASLKNQTRLICADSLDSEDLDSTLGKLPENIKKEDIVFYIVSKSGNTLETLLIADFVLDHFYKRSCVNKDNVFVATEDDSKLHEFAKKMNFRHIPMDKNVGGRFSIFSPWVAFAGAVLGIDMVEFKESADHAITDLTSKRDSSVFDYSDLFIESFNQFGVHDIWTEADYLTPLAKWYEQLFAESLGKTIDDGISFSLLPNVRNITRDLHSVMQMYSGAKIKRPVLWLSAKEENTSANLSSTAVNFVFRKELSLTDVKKALVGSIKQEYMNLSLAPIFAESDKISSPIDIAKFVIWAMLSVSYIGWSLGIDTYTQPDVESYKKVAKNKLGI